MIKISLIPYGKVAFNREIKPIFFSEKEETRHCKTIKNNEVQAYDHKTFEYNFRTGTPKLSYQNRLLKESLNNYGQQTTTSYLKPFQQKTYLFEGLF
jgi:hypothetical protein